MSSFQEKMTLFFCPYEEMSLPTLQTAHGNFQLHCQMVLLPNIHFLISKQNKTLKIDQKC